MSKKKDGQSIGLINERALIMKSILISLAIVFCSISHGETLKTYKLDMSDEETKMPITGFVASRFRTVNQLFNKTESITASFDSDGVLTGYVFWDEDQNQIDVDLSSASDFKFGIDFKGRGLTIEHKPITPVLEHIDFDPSTSIMMTEDFSKIIIDYGYTIRIPGPSATVELKKIFKFIEN